MTDAEARWKREIERELGAHGVRLKTLEEGHKRVDALNDLVWRLVGGLVLASALVPVGVLIWATLYTAG